MWLEISNKKSVRKLRDFFEFVGQIKETEIYGAVVFKVWSLEQQYQSGNLEMQSCGHTSVLLNQRLGLEAKKILF
jgi:hypothetical protein